MPCSADVLRPRKKSSRGPLCKLWLPVTRRSGARDFRRDPTPDSRLPPGVRAELFAGQDPPKLCAGKEAADVPFRDGYAAPFLNARIQMHQQSRLNLRNSSEILPGTGKHGKEAPGVFSDHKRGPLSAQQRGMDPARCAIPVPDPSPGSVFLEDLHGHPGTHIHPSDRVTRAGPDPEIRAIGINRDEPGKGQAGAGMYCINTCKHDRKAKKDEEQKPTGEGADAAPWPLLEAHCSHQIVCSP